MTVIHVLAGPSYVTAMAPDGRETRWCFRCRKHLRHTWFMLDDPPERQPSYYDPVPVLRCSRCQGDHAEFPGSHRDGPLYPDDIAVWKCLCKLRADELRTWDWDAIWKRFREATDPCGMGDDHV